MTPTQREVIEAYMDAVSECGLSQAAGAGTVARLVKAERALLDALAEPAPEPINFDAAFDAVNWDEWRHQPVRELVRELHRVTAPVREPAPVQEPVAYVANGGYRSSACMKSPGEYGRMEGWEKKYYQPLFIAPQPAPPTDVPMLTDEELNLARQWFGCIQDANNGWLDKKDFKLAVRLYEMCGMRVPDSVRQKAGLP